MELTAYLNFNGQCEEAFKFYERCFGGKIVSMVTYEAFGQGAHVPAGWGDRIMHGHMTVGKQVLFGSDAPTDQFEKPQGFSMSIQVEQPAEAERVFAALAEKGTVTMPLQQTGWSARFGMLTDQFGIPWMVNCAAAASA